MTTGKRDVRFTPKSGHQSEGVECPLCADIVVEVGSFGCDVPASVFFETSSYYAPLGSGITYQLY
ncbi:MAG: hypothetical protein WCB32_13115 [Pseudolabrys sp.]